MNTLRWWNKWSRASATETFKVEDLDGNTIYVEIMYLLRTPEELWLGYNAHHQWMLSFVTTTFLSTRPPEYVLPPDKVCLSWWVWCVNVLVWYHPLQKLQILTMSKTMEWWPRTTKLLLLGRCTGVSLKCNGYNTLDLDFTTLQFEKIGNTFELPPNIRVCILPILSVWLLKESNCFVTTLNSWFQSWIWPRAVSWKGVEANHL